MLRIDPHVPVAGLELLQEPVADLLPRSQEKGRVESAGELNMVPPLPLFTITLQDLLAGAIVSNATLTAWQYLLFDDQNRHVQTAELRGTQGDILAFSALIDDCRGVVDAIAVAEEAPALARGDYALRVLRAPDLSFQALWLSGAGDNRFLPLRRVPDPLEFGALYSENELVAALRPLALRRLRQSSDETVA
ncbi:MAG: hypothetical protein JWN02_1060 [Acidobacteria bacterium]|nr:hypothetical protein [Acidobacteriota bacterium]